MSRPPFRYALLQTLGILCCVAFAPCFFFLSIEDRRGLWGVLMVVMFSFFGSQLFGI